METKFIRRGAFYFVFSCRFSLFENSFDTLTDRFLLWKRDQSSAPERI